MSDSRSLAVVTGASSGIGAAFARKLAAQGYDLLLVARRADRLAQVAAPLESAHHIHAEALPADLSDDAGLRIVEQRIAAAPDLDFLVNNAGFGSRGRFFEIEVDSQDKMHRLHVMATMRLTHAALPGMVARKKGSVVNVSSVAAFGQSPGNTSYCATKAWMNSFTEGLYLELQSSESPVKVQALCPGFTLSEFHDVMGFDRKRIPASLWMTADDVVEASLSALARNQLIVIPGWRYRTFVFLQRLMPQVMRHAAAIKYAQNARREVARS